MDFWIAVVNGIIEGLTEFLPVSSTGHLILAGSLLNPFSDVSQEKLDSFKVFIQLGAILAVTIVYWRRILQLLGINVPQVQVDGSGNSKTVTESPTRSINMLHVLIAITPALGLAYIFRDFIKAVFFGNNSLVLISLVLGGILMIFAEKKQPRVTSETIDRITYSQALRIGLFQCLSLWPGFSRSGASISGGMLSGVSYRAAADFSFLIAIPIMFAASGYEMLSMYDKLSMDDFGFFATGFIAAFLVALVVVVTALKHLTKIKLTYFAYYRFALAGLFWLFIIN
jgi:undecaprenyl-diphosphatase